jgi:ABC-type spermidine/putrescine transport system permease subunit I
MTLSRASMPEYITRFGETPLHLRVSAVLSAYLFALFFLPSQTMTLFSQKKLTVSFFQLLQTGSMRLNIREASYTLSFSGAMPWFILSLLLPLLLFALVLLYPAAVKKIPGRILSGASLVLAVATMFVRLLAAEAIISPNFYQEAGINTKEFFFSGTILENIGIILCILIGILCVFGTFGVKIRLRMLSYPYFLWLLVFTILPLLLIVIAAFFEKQPNGNFAFTLEGFRALMVDRVIETQFYGISVRLQEYFSVFLRSLDYATCTTIGCLLIAYPLAYVMAARTRRQHTDSSLMLMFFVLPMWINTMLRTYAWRAFFGQTGVLNNFLLSIGLVSDPILFLKLDLLSDLIVKIVLVNDFLPFMLLPIYSVLVKLDENVKQAAHDLGANSRQTFLRVILPLSLPGVISGIQMVFMPSLTFYMIPDIISEGSVTTIGSTVQAFILSESPVQQLAGNALSLLLLIFVLITMGILRNSDKDSGGGGMIL